MTRRHPITKDVVGLAYLKGWSYGTWEAIGRYKGLIPEDGWNPTASEAAAYDLGMRDALFMLFGIETFKAWQQGRADGKRDQRAQDQRDRRKKTGVK